jgi:hypothetical protein
LNLFKSSEYRLCLIPPSLLEKYDEKDIIVIKPDQAGVSQKDDWAEYVKWIVGVDWRVRSEFFNSYEKSGAANEITIGIHLLEYYKKHIKNLN